MPQDDGMPIDNEMNMGQEPMPQGGETSMDDGMGINQEPMPQGGEQSEFDTNFDAGVEADEESDPKKYIQQLTGKLSTTLNSYNSENGDDEGLNKYVAKMIVKASTKNMDDSQKKDIIKAINTSSDEVEDIEDNNDETVNQEPQPQDNGMEQEIQERCFTKKDLLERYKKI